MLIITRKEGESFVIGDDIKVQVTLAEGTSVRLGIQAPREVVVLREEVAERATRHAP